MNISKCITEFFSPASSEPIGLCSFEHTTENKKKTKSKPKQKKEMRLSEIME